MRKRAIIPHEYAAASRKLQLSPAVWSRGHLFLTGVTGSLPDGSMPEDPNTQFRSVFNKIGATLETAGASFSSIVELTSYHIDIDTYFDRFADVRAAYVRAPYPAWTSIGVAGLRRPGALVEVRVIAEAPETEHAT